MMTRQQCEVTELLLMNKIKCGGKEEGEEKLGSESEMHHSGSVHQVTLKSVIQQLTK